MENDVVIVGAGVGGLSTAALLAKHGISVRIFEKSSSIGGRTACTKFKDHVLDNGFHIMPFYKKSAIYEILKIIGIESRLELAKVDLISFYADSQFHRYPKGILDLLRLSLIPFKSRIALLKMLLPMAFSSIEKSESLDNISLKDATKKLDPSTNSFFEAVCMLAFADTPDHISLGEFTRTIIRANPFKGGTSEFAYPKEGGYDSISRILAEYVLENKGSLFLDSPIKKIIIKNGHVKGIIDKNNEFLATNCVVVSNPAYLAIKEIFEDGIFDKKFVDKVNRLNKTTSVVEIHFALNKKLDNRQIIFPVGDNYTTKGIFFISNITPSVSPTGEHLMIAGTPVQPSDAKNPKKIKEIVEKIKKEISDIYPEFTDSLLWERPMAWNLVESVVKEPGLVWKSKMPHEIPSIKGLYFVGDSTISYGIGTDSAAHSAILCTPKIISQLEKKQIIVPSV